ncbi:phage major capsid protein [Psychromonas sp. KJ10-2]|uniref:phage major capsid protein n=1 Tax=Psychromonas sp. KJ10-2 TaxID=3391822 RepID=UPI0039B419AC
MKNLIKLQRELAGLRTEMRNLLTVADEETRSLNEAEKSKFDELRNKADGLKETITRHEALEHEEERSLSNVAEQTSKHEMPTDTELRNFLLRDEVSTRSMDTSTTSDVMIPEVQRQIMMALRDRSPIRRLAANKTTSTHEYQLPVQINGASVAEAAENDTRGETSTPTLTMATATLSEVYAQPKVSQQLLDMNAGFDIQGFVNQSVADAYADKEGQKFADVLNNATASAGAFVFGEIRTEDVPSVTYGATYVSSIRSLTKTVKQAIRKNATFLVSPDVLTYWEDLVDKDDKPMVGTVEGGGSKRFLGYPVEECEELAEGSLYFGDFNRGMFTVDHTSSMGSVVDRVTEKGQVKYYSYIYSAAALADHKALVKANFTA